MTVIKSLKVTLPAAAAFAKPCVEAPLPRAFSFGSAPAGPANTWDHDGHFFKRFLTRQQVGGSSADHLEELAAIVLG